MNILGIYPQGPNTASSLLVDGKLTAFAEEERFTRVKLASNTIPTRSTAYCLAESNVKWNELECVTVGWANNLYPDTMGKFFREDMEHPDKDEYGRIYELLSINEKNPVYFDKRMEIAYKRAGFVGDFPKLIYNRHHLCHAYSVFYPSPFERSIIMVIDGSGEEMATSFWIGEGENIKFLRSYNIPNSLGFFYAAITEFLGFSVFTGEGKVMGLAPYGRPNPEISKALDKIIHVGEGGYSVDPAYLYYYKSRSQSFRHTDLLSETLGHAPKMADEEFSDWHMSLAWEVQNKLETTVGELLRNVIKETGIKDVCMAGGVAMNCKMNGYVSEMQEVDRVFVFPASTDAGCSYGSALLQARKGGETSLREKAQDFSPYLGPSYTSEQVEKALRGSGNLDRAIRFSSDEEMIDRVAGLIARGKLIGWFQGRMEIGARALGNRSILANPASEEMKDIINSQVKHREGFRPFAPAMAMETANQVFEVPDREEYLPYYSWMLKAAQASEAARNKIPAVVHVDNSIRPQVVSSTSNKKFHQLLTAFHGKTGVPALLNTSFNVRGEPIVCTPIDAIRCFYSTGLDICVIENFMLAKGDINDGD